MARIPTGGDTSAKFVQTSTTDAVTDQTPKTGGAKPTLGLPDIVRQRFGGDQKAGAIPDSKQGTLTGADASRFATISGKATAAKIDAVRYRQVAPTADEQEFLEDLARAFYPVDHPNMHLVSGVIDLDKVGVGRRDETGRLKKVALSVPFALGGEWKFSPMAKKKGFEFDLTKALEQHSKLANYLLSQGVEVYLSLQVEGASESVYNTDVVTGIGDTAFIGNPKHDERSLERDGYEGGVDLKRFGGTKGPIEFGDVLLFSKNDTQFVFQGFNSWRGTKDSVAAMGDALKFLKARGSISKFQHVPVQLSGQDTLHLDYVFNYAGTGSKRVMTVYPEGFADPSQIDELARILGVPEERIIRVTEEEMLAGACNLCGFSPDEVLYIDNEHTKRVAQRMRDVGLKVTGFEFDQMSQKDGTVHCCIGQLQRE